MSSTVSRLELEFDADVLKRLKRRLLGRPDTTVSSVVSRYVDEALRMEEHPGVYFQEGPAGRRPTVIGGPDVWEIVRAVKQIREAEPDLDGKELVQAVLESTGVTERALNVAMNYWSDYPDEIDEWIRDADEFGDQAYERWQRRERLLP